MTNFQPSIKLSPRRYRRKGEPYVWLSGGTMALGMVMIVAIVGLVVIRGTSSFWPSEIEQFTLGDGRVLTGSVEAERPLGLGDLPPKFDGTPWKQHELPASRENLGPAKLDGTPWKDEDIPSEAPRELLIMQGNQESGISGSYFTWVKSDIPDLQRFQAGNPHSYASAVVARKPIAGIARIERLEKGVLTGFVVAVKDGDEVKIAKTDGRTLDEVWAVFGQERDKAVAVYEERVRLETDELGDANAEIAEYDRRIKRIAYDHRDSKMFVAAMQWLNKQYDLWVAKRTPPEEIMSAHGGDTGNIDELRRRQLAEYETILQEWRGTLSTYIGDIGKLTAQYPLTDAERVYIAEVFGIMHVRADVFATLFSLTDLKVKQIRADEEKATFTLETADGRSADIPLVKVVRAWRPNEMGFFDKLGVYFDRAWEFLTAKPREANSEGGILVVIIGTLIMTMLMAVAVVPFGVITALYLREYARQGAIVSAVRIAVNNLAGVPSIVFGIFGLGFFCVIVGGSIDSLWYPELLPSPTFGGGGIMWASLTLALLTIPVVVVATEEALASVPSAQREASLGCGASKFQTIWKVVLPQSMPGILTGTILAMARGAGEVAPLMLVGAVKAAEDLPIDGTSPFVHLERKFMHLGFHVYDLGFQPPDTDKTKPLVFSTALVLLLLIGLLNIFAIRLRNRLRKKLQTSHV